MINVNLENQTFEINGEIPALLTELEYIIADLYITLHLEKGISNKDIDQLYDEVKRNGMKKAWEVIKKTAKIEGQSFLKDYDKIPEVII